jgi:hypothetical protein
MRIAIIVLSNPKAVNRQMNDAEMYQSVFIKSYFFLEKFNLASVQGMSILRSLMDDNSKAAFANRSLMKQSDIMIIHAN